MSYIRALCKFIDQNINDFKMFWGDPCLALFIKGYSLSHEQVERSMLEYLS